MLLHMYIYEIIAICIIHTINMLPCKFLSQWCAEIQISLVNIVHFYWSLSGCGNGEPGNMHPCNFDMWSWCHFESTPKWRFNCILIEIRNGNKYGGTLQSLWTQDMGLTLVSEVQKVHFHMSSSKSGMGILEICTHVIPMPESHIYPHFTQPLLPNLVLVFFPDTN